MHELMRRKNELELRVRTREDKQQNSIALSNSKGVSNYNYVENQSRDTFSLSQSIQNSDFEEV